MNKRHGVIALVVALLFALTIYHYLMLQEMRTLTGLLTDMRNNTMEMQAALPDVTHLSAEGLDTILANCNGYFRLRGETS